MSLRLLAVIGIAWLSGCSFLFVDTPPTVAPHAQPRAVDCTSSKVAPVLDTIFAGLEVVRTGFALAADDSDYSDYPISRGADIGFGVGFTALFAASAAYGYINTGECADLETRVAASPSEERRAWTPPPSVPPPAPHVACTVDTQCKGDRICEQGRCVAPPSPAIESPVPIAPPSAPDAQPATPAPAPQPSAPAQPPSAAPAP